MPWPMSGGAGFKLWATSIDAEFELRREMAARSGLPLTMTLLQKEARPEEGRIEEANAEGLRITAQICGRPTSVLLAFGAVDQSV